MKLFSKQDHIHNDTKIVPGGTYLSVVCRGEYSMQGVEGPWTLQSFEYLDKLLVLNVMFLDSGWKASIALTGYNWKREVVHAP